VATRGFHAVGVSDIGAAAGVSGAALYRHFATKTDILVALLDRVLDELLVAAVEIESREAPADSLLRDLVSAHVDFAITHRSVLAVYAQEFHHLPPPDRRRLRAKQRRYVEIWSAAHRRLDAGASEAQARVRVEAVFGLINSVPNVSVDIPEDLLRAELTRLAEGALIPS
jgi:AcrR family transcriptional regulator